MKTTILTLINGSLGGDAGNTSFLLKPWIDALESHAQVQTLHLAQCRLDAEAFQNEILPLLQKSDGFIFASGTYWDSWGSPLQRFLEEATDLEAGEVWHGKPAAVVITMHSVGGKGVLSRLQGVLSTMGLLIPPMSGMTYSLAAHLALQAPTPSEFAADLWQLNDLKVIEHNLMQATDLARGKAPQWKSWPVDDRDPRRKWFTS